MAFSVFLATEVSMPVLKCPLEIPVLYKVQKVLPSAGYQALTAHRTKINPC